MRTIKCLFRESNIIDVTFGNASRQMDDKQSRWCHVQCLNVVVYTEWLYRSSIMLGRRMDLIPTKIALTTLNPTAWAWEVIAETMQPITNAIINNATIIKMTFNKAMMEWEEKLVNKLATLASSINPNTN